MLLAFLFSRGRRHTRCALVTGVQTGALPISLEHFPNLVTMFFTRAREGGDTPFLWRKQDGHWVATSWAEAARQAAGLAAALKALGRSAERGGGKAVVSTI